MISFVQFGACMSFKASLSALYINFSLDVIGGGGVAVAGGGTSRGYF